MGRTQRFALCSRHPTVPGPDRSVGGPAFRASVSAPKRVVALTSMWCRCERGDVVREQCTGRCEQDLAFRWLVTESRGRLELLHRPCSQVVLPCHHVRSVGNTSVMNVEARAHCDGRSQLGSDLVVTGAFSLISQSRFLPPLRVYLVIRARDTPWRRRAAEAR